MIKLLNRLQQQILDSLNKVEAPNFVGTPEEDDVCRHLWAAQGSFNDRPILAYLHGAAVQFVLNTDGTMAMLTCYHALTREDLFEINAYMRQCEEAIAGLDDGEALVQRRDIDAALQAANPEFRKTDAFRRLDDAMGA